MDTGDLPVILCVKGYLCMDAGEGQCHQYTPVLLVAWEEGQVSPMKMLKSAVDTKLGASLV